MVVDTMSHFGFLYIYIYSIRGAVLRRQPQARTYLLARSSVPRVAHVIPHRDFLTIDGLRPYN